MNLQPLICRFLSTLIFLTASILSWAYDFEMDGIYYKISGSNVIVTYKDDNYNSYTGDVTIPSTVTYNDVVYNVTSIGTSAFSSCKGLTSINIPNGVTVIANFAFLDCEGLTSINIPNSVRTIVTSAFYGCKGLTSIDIPNSVTSIGSDAFMNCSSLTSIKLSENLTEIGQSAFNSCTSLEKVNIPGTVRSIGSRAFYDCSNLSTLVLENSTSELTFESTRYTTYTFYDCPLKKIYIGRPIYFYPLNMSPFIGCEIDSLIVGGKIQIDRGGNNCYDHFKKCKHIRILKQVEEISTTPFASIQDLNSIEVEDGNPIYDSRDNCNAIIETSTNTLIFGFDKTIIPNSVRIIGERAFNNYYRTSLEIPDGVVSIGKFAFCNLYNLNTIIIPQSVRFIGENAFYNCRNIKDVYCANMPSTFATDIFTACDIKNAVLHVPSSLIVAFKSVSPWNEFGTILPYDPSGVDEQKTFGAKVGVDAPIYDLNGHRLKEKPEQGVYIQNGKKYSTK